MAKVLLVEDDNNLREIYQARLMAEGYEIVAAQNGEEALVSAKQNKPDLIISDVMMPRISGFEMLDILRNTDELKNTKVIMLTALGQAEDQTRADNLGADKYLVKSQVTLEDIVNAAKELLGENGAAPANNPYAAAAEETAAATATAAPAPAEATTPPSTEEPAAAPAMADSLAPTPPVNTADDTSLGGSSPAEPVAPASVIPQPNTTVVVPPAPANPAPTQVTVTPLPPEPTAAATYSPSPTAPLVDDSAPTLSVDTEASTATPAEAVPPFATDSSGEAAEAAEPAVEADSSAALEPAAEASVASASPQSLDAEEAALQAQIDDFANQTAAAPTEAPVISDDASNQQTLASAVEQLNGTLPTPDETKTTTPNAEPTDQAQSAAGDSEIVAHKKIIRPISNNLDTSPNLAELLAKEEAAQATPAASPATNEAAPQNTPPTPAAAAGQSFDPNSISL